MRPRHSKDSTLLRAVLLSSEWSDRAVDDVSFKCRFLTRNITFTNGQFRKRGTSRLYINAKLAAALRGFNLASRFTFKLGIVGSRRG